MTAKIRSLSWQPVAFCLVYVLCASPVAWQAVQCTNAATNALDQIADKQSLANEGAQVVAAFVVQHKVIGSYLASDFDRDFHLPSLQDSSQALAQIPSLEQQAAEQEGQAVRWSWLLLGLSALYLLSAVLSPRAALLRHALFATTGVSAVFFAVCITASALRISTIASHFFGTTPVLQHQVRSILSVISELFSRGPWVLGAAIALFSVLTPCAKIALTYVATLTRSRARSAKISDLLNVIGRWSMADVLVAAILLASFTLRAGVGSQVTACRGLYYFAGYCLLSLVTESMLARIIFDEE